MHIHSKPDSRVYNKYNFGTLVGLMLSAIVSRGAWSSLKCFRHSGV